MNSWYYVKGGEWFGPVGGDDLKRLAAVGLIQPGDLVWREGAEGWVAASRVKGLVPAPTGAAAITAIPPLPSPGAFDDLAAETPVREPASNKLRPGRRKLLIWAGAGGMTLAGLALVLVVASLARRDGPGIGGLPFQTGGDEALTEDHDPDMTGKVRRFDWVWYQPDGSAFKKLRFVETYKADGKRHHWEEAHPKAVTLDDGRRRVRGDEVQHSINYNGRLAWIPRIKVGAKPGATWEFKSPQPEKRIRWTYKESATERGKPCAVVLEEHLDGEQAQESWLRWYGKGVGVVKQEGRKRSRSGKLHLDRVWVFEDSTEPGGVDGKAIDDFVKGMAAAHGLQKWDTVPLSGKDGAVAFGRANPQHPRCGVPHEKWTGS